MAKGLSRSLRGSRRSGVSSIGVWAASYPVVCDGVKTVGSSVMTVGSAYVLFRVPLACSVCVGVVRPAVRVSGAYNKLRFV